MDELSPMDACCLSSLPAKNFHAYVYSAPFFMQTNLIEHAIWVLVDLYSGRIGLRVGVKKICYGNGITLFGGLGFLTCLS
jgi:hypothetical protein